VLIIDKLEVNYKCATGVRRFRN